MLIERKAGKIYADSEVKDVTPNTTVYIGETLDKANAENGIELLDGESLFFPTRPFVIAEVPLPTRGDDSDDPDDPDDPNWENYYE